MTSAAIVLPDSSSAAPAVHCLAGDASVAAAVVRGEHMCMQMRGISKHGADMVTTALRGVLATDQALRTTAIDLLRSR